VLFPPIVYAKEEEKIYLFYNRNPEVFLTFLRKLKLRPSTSLALFLVTLSLQKLLGLLLSVSYHYECFYVPGVKTTLSIFVTTLDVPKTNSNSSKYCPAVAVKEIEFEFHTPGPSLSLASTVYCGTPLNLTPMKPPLPTLKKVSNVSKYVVSGVM
jgi:hypothetical protein